MSTTELLNDFSAFAVAQLSKEGERSIDDLYEEWRGRAFADIDARAIVASVRDLESGDRGKPLDEFFATLEGRRGKAT